MTRILVVDDEPQIRKALSVNLRARGYEVDLAATGEEALTLAAGNHPDLVLLDIGLPGINGIEVVEDNNTGHLIYISETGSIAVLPKK